MGAVQHAALNCRNMKAQEQFYTKHFGFRRSAHKKETNDRQREA